MMDVENKNWTAKAKTTWDQAKEFAKQNDHSILNCCHLFLCSFKNANDSFLEFIESRGIEIFQQHTEVIFDKFSKQNKNLFYSESNSFEFDSLIGKAIQEAEYIASKKGNSFIGVEHLIYGIVKVDEKFSEFLLSKDIDTEHLRFCIETFIAGEGWDEEMSGLDGFDDEDDDAMLDNESFFNKYCSSLNERVSDPSFPKISGRDKQISLMEEVLCRKMKSNCILVGEAGTGKTTIVEGLAQVINSESYEGPLANKKIYSLDLGSLVAGTKYRGQFEERFSKMLKYLKESDDKILFIDEIHSIIGTGSREGSQDLSNMLKPALARGEIKCIGATTSTEYKKHFEKDQALCRRFHIVNVEEPAVADVISMMEDSMPVYEEHHKVKFSKSLVSTLVKMCETYLPHQRFPDKAFDVMDHSCSKARIKSSAENINVSISDVCSVIADKIGVDVKTIKDSSNQLFSEFENNINKKVFGQNKIVSKIYDLLACGKSGFQEKNKPIASFFFVGPTSVGKTHAAKEISKHFYGNDKSFLQLNMSEYQEASSISKLIGASAGYVGFEEGGILTEFVRKNPNSLVLFDEAEKCNPSILNLLLQILDEGKLNDNLNRSVDFSRSIVVLTSNIGADQSSKQQMGFVPEVKTNEQNYQTSVAKFLAPELIARIDEVLVFEKLNQDSISKIFAYKIEDLESKLKATGIIGKFQIEAKDFIDFKNSEDHARNIKKIIRTKIEVPISKFLIQNPKKKKIEVKMLDGKLEIC